MSAVCVCDVDVQVSSTEDVERDITSTVMGIYQIQRKRDVELGGCGNSDQRRESSNQCRQCHHGVQHAVYALNLSFS